MRNGRSHHLLDFYVSSFVIRTDLTHVCRLKDKYHPTNLIAVIERCVFYVNEKDKDIEYLCLSIEA